RAKSHNVGLALLPPLKTTQVRYNVLGNAGQPVHKTPGRSIFEAADVAVGFHQGFLEDVIDVDQAPQILSQLIVNQYAEPPPVFVKEASECLAIAVLDALNQVVSRCHRLHDQKLAGQVPISDLSIWILNRRIRAESTATLSVGGPQYNRDGWTRSCRPGLVC